MNMRRLTSRNTSSPITKAMLDMILLSLLFFGVYHVSAFQSSLPAVRKATTMPYYSFQLHDVRFENKYFQLEEMEDKDRCTTELFLRADRRVQIGITDGPRHSDGVGTWEVQEGGTILKMTLVRKFNAGDKKTDMGEFSYDIRRNFEGSVTLIGNLVGIEGCTRAEANQEVGYFTMIDTTEDREKNIDTAGGQSIASRGF
mmetsp:Transcript_28051/g.42779  ORF Transcript_28051/g.42779 Transcript_28051/m.42779 type:complete len:200 (-) Transcript_28051:95-694(-)